MQETWETWVWSLSREDPLEEEMTTHSSILAWRIPRTEGPGGIQSIGPKESDTTEQLTLSLFQRLLRWTHTEHQPPDAPAFVPWPGVTAKLVTGWERGFRWWPPGHSLRRGLVECPRWAGPVCLGDWDPSAPSQAARLVRPYAMHSGRAERLVGGPAWRLVGRLPQVKTGRAGCWMAWPGAHPSQERLVYVMNRWRGRQPLGVSIFLFMFSF